MCLGILQHQEKFTVDEFQSKKQGTYYAFQDSNDSGMLHLSFQGLSRACTGYNAKKERDAYMFKG